MTAEAPIFDTPDALAQHLAASTAGRVVVAQGCFDPLHVGHVRYLAAAKEHGDYLVVGLHDDASTRDLKGEGRPVMSVHDRARLVAGMKSVDAVFILDTTDASAALESIRPACFAVRGTEASNAAAKAPDVETVTISDADGISSNDVVGRIRGS